MKSIIVAMRRTNCTDLDVESTANDIINQFSPRSRNFLVNAIRNGSLGEYGINYNLSAQVIGYWIYQYSKQQNIKNGLA